MNKWTPELIAKEAKKYTTRSKFTTTSQKAAIKAKELGIYDEVCSHMEEKHKKWTYKLLHKEALKYNTRGDFQLNNCSAYQRCIQKGILDEICAHMYSMHTNWTIELVKSIALKYTRRVDFQEQDNNAYSTAKRKGWLEEVCKHMIPVFNTWTDKELRQEALRYEYRVDFQMESKGAYLAAYKRGLLQEICSHMEYKEGSTQLSNPMYMYYIRIDTLNGSLPSVWKIGITKYKDPMRRFKKEISIVKTKITVLKTWYFNIGYDATKAERNVMDTYKEYSYYGDSPLIETKTTEMFTEDVLNMEVPDA